MNGILRDIACGARLLVRSPGFAAAAILVLGVGIGAGSAAFRLGDSFFLRPLPIMDALRRD